MLLYVKCVLLQDWSEYRRPRLVIRTLHAQLSWTYQVRTFPMHQPAKWVNFVCREIVNSSSVILHSVVRHPYHRLVSTYEAAEAGWLYGWRKTSFSGFIQRIVDEFARGDLMNSHWRPFYDACSYCSLPYNFISKV